MRLRNHDYVLGALLVIGAFAAGFAQNPTPQPKKQLEVISCTVGEVDKDGRRAIHCPEFDYLVTAWPRELELYKSKGEVVHVTVDGERIRIIPPTCQERIRKAFLQHADGSIHNNIDAITPADCVSIPKKDREQFAKEQ